ncbi:DUF305 domain-containing protein [Spongiactinospora gelatinilytica]|uniref:DUF305 domain-containing protein n=1 Tax=Spongiactinospora gelatinilytica TaxID=2666298 RepID=UPI001F237D1F|nr:DUF305 domain-containing protein [Spongiactinospora gelatinilytica]
MRPTSSPFAVLTALVLSAALTSGCAVTPTTARPPYTAAATAPVIAPGEPGEAARTLAPHEAATAVPAPTANAADVRFVRDMVIHHRQAVDLSLLAPTRASSTELKRLAARIEDVQGPEIAMMAGWLREQGQQVPGHHSAHQGMPGMATPAQLDQLRTASGSAFDRLYISLMTAHHQGAITMAAKVIAAGSHPKVREIAEDISVTQTAELHRMARLAPPARD